MRSFRPALVLAMAAFGGAVVAAPPQRIIVYPYHVTVEGAGAARFQGMHRGPPARVRGRSGEAYVPVTLVRGVSEDPGFAGWVGVVQKRGAPRMKHRSSVAIVIRGPRGGPGTTTSLRGCWVADYRATPERGRHGMLIERLGLRCAPGADR